MNEQELESLLAVYRYNKPLRLRRRRRIWPALAAAAAAAIVVVLMLRPPKNEWRLDGRTLHPGDIVQATAPMRLEARAVGLIDIAPNTRLELVESRAGRQRLVLASGTIHARTISPPGVFVIDSPLARAIDLGCEYTLYIAPGGSGSLHVESGWVDLTHGFDQTLVPAHASAVIDAQGGLTPPYFDDAASELRSAVVRHDVKTILAHARRRDAFTLLNLFRHAAPDERPLIYDRLNALVPAPPSITRDSVREIGRASCRERV